MTYLSRMAFTSWTICACYVHASHKCVYLTTGSQEGHPITGQTGRLENEQTLQYLERTGLLFVLAISQITGRTRGTNKIQRLAR